jgi:hypothetical protein
VESQEDQEDQEDHYHGIIHLQPMDASKKDDSPDLTSKCFKIANDPTKLSQYQSKGTQGYALLKGTEGILGFVRVTSLRGDISRVKPKRREFLSKSRQSLSDEYNREWHPLVGYVCQTRSRHL